MGSPILTSYQFNRLKGEPEAVLDQHRDLQGSLPSPRVRYHDLQAMAAKFSPHCRALAQTASELQRLREELRRSYAQFEERACEFQQRYEKVRQLETRLETELRGRSAEVLVHEALEALRNRGYVTAFLYADANSDLDRNSVDFLIWLPDYPEPCPLQVKAQPREAEEFQREQEGLRQLIASTPDAPVVPIEVIATNRYTRGQSRAKAVSALMRELRLLLQCWERNQRTRTAEPALTSVAEEPLG